MPPDSPSTARSKPAWRELAADELGDDAPGDVGVDRELARAARSSGVTVAVAGLRGRVTVRGRRGTGASVDAIGSSALGATSSPGSAPDSAVESARQPGALGDDPLQLAHLQLGPLVAQQRQGDPLAPDVVEVDVDVNRPSS